MGLRGWHAVVREQEPETKDRLGKDIENGVTDNLGIDTDVPGAISDTPDAKNSQRGEQIQLEH